MRAAHQMAAWIPAPTVIPAPFGKLRTESRTPADGLNQDIWRKPQKPSPSGRGLGEGETQCAGQRHITPHNPTVIPATIPVIPATIPVIPATIPVIPAPYSSFPRKRESTPRPFATPGYTGVLDSGLRRNDGMGRQRMVMDGGVWIPAFAGMTNRGRE